MKEQQYTDLDFEGIAELDLTRREFMKLFGGGIVILFFVGDPSALAAQRGRGYPEDFNAYLRIEADGKVTCFSGKIEMGQGVVTSLAQMLAEEMDIRLEAVEMVMGDTSVCPWDMGTFGSMSTRFFGPAVRAAGARARTVLIELAAARLNVPQEQLATGDGAVFDKLSRDKKVSYGELAKGQTIARTVSGQPPLRKPSEFKVMGKTVLRRDSHEKVTGAAKYAGDIRLDGMVYAKILRPPSHGAVLKNVDTSAAETVEGVQIVRDGDMVAVLHAIPEAAERALSQIKAEFGVPEPKIDDETIFDHLLTSAGAGQVVDRGGDIKTGEGLAEIFVEQKYLDGYVAHAPIEPHAAVAEVKDGKATVWASTQTPFPLKDQVARAQGLGANDVRVITPFVGGGFGGKTANQQAIEAARLAKLCGKPVQVAWTRGEEFFYDAFRPAAVIKIRSGVTKAGKITFWDYEVYFAGSRGAGHFYDIAHHRTQSGGGGFGGGPSPHPFATGAWRAPANNTNTFARESQIDIMAAQVGMDPVEFRLANLRDERMIRVLKTAAEKFGWKPAKAPSGRGVGVSCGIDAGTYVAHIAEVEVEESGQVRVKRVVCAQEMGVVVNPEGATIQMEGCITMGLGYALSETIHFKGGKILDANFDTYSIPRFSWVPKIETVLVKADDISPQGGGEPAIINMGAVIANAIYDAVGARLTRMPMTPKRVLEATPAASQAASS
jgi:nicotinate dehydrogenase subunit B